MLSSPPTKLLYVEDDEDLRGLVATALADNGYDVTEVGSAEDALDRLDGARFDALLTDYNLPGETGAWLLARASERGLLRQTPAIVLTSERKPHGVDGFVVLRKPVDFALLLAALGDAVGQVPVSSDTPAAAAPGPIALELVLYVTATSLESQKAVRNLHRVLRGFDATRVRLSVIDVATIADDDETWSGALEDDRVIVTPTLVKRWPLPKAWIVGTLVRPEPVVELVASALGGSQHA